MPKRETAARTSKTAASVSLMVRMDEESKSFIAEAADLRRISVSDYVRTVTVTQAQREVEFARNHTISLTPTEQITFWNALNGSSTLTDSQRQLGALMRGES